MSPSPDPFSARETLQAGGREYVYHRLEAVRDDLDRTPFTIKVLLESVLRNCGRGFVTEDDVRALAAWRPNSGSAAEVPFLPARVVMQDFTGVPCVVNLAAMRDAMAELGGDPSLINPLVPADLVIDHSVQVNRFGDSGAFAANVEREYERNRERYMLLRWAQQAFADFRTVPPGTGIVHQVNLEYLSPVVQARELDGELTAFPDTLVGTDSHTTMINGLGVLGFGVGGIEAEAVLLGQPLSQPTPTVIGLKLTGRLGAGATATDLVLTVTEMLRAHGVVGTFVELYGAGLSSLSLADRATISNMSPEFGATATMFPIDDETLRYMEMTGRPAETIALAEAYAKAQGLFRTDESPDPGFDETLELDLGSVEPSLAGPRRPQDRVALGDVAGGFRETYSDGLEANGAGPHYRPVEVRADGDSFPMASGSVAIAAITSCTNTSNPSVMVGAGLLAKKAVERGLTTPPWVKTSLAPGSRAVTGYLDRAGLTQYLERLRFDLVGYGCTTCIGNSGPLAEPIANAIEENGLVAAAVLSGNRNFEGRIHPQIRASYLASPPLVVAYALAGRVDIDLTSEPLGEDGDGNPVYLSEIWPTPAEVAEAVGGVGQPRAVRVELLDGLRRRRPLDRAARPRGPDLRLGPRVDLRPAAALLRGHQRRARSDHRHRRRAGARGAGRLDHHRPHLAGRQHPGQLARRALPAGARRGAARLQQLRLAARQPRGDDARHLRQHPAAQPPRRRQGGQLDRAPARAARSRASTRPRCATRRRARRWWCWPARSTATARAATGRPRARCCSASGPWSRSRSSASTAATWWAWASCRSSSWRARASTSSA